MTDRRAAFAAFWACERDRLYRALTLAVGDGDLAAEAVDEAMLRAWQRWDEVAGYTDPAAWVFRVAHNWSVSWLRKWNRRPTRSREQLDRAIRDRVSDVDVWRAVAELPDAHRAVLVLRFWLDWEVDRVADALDVAPGTVRSRTHRALKILGDRQEMAR